MQHETDLETLNASICGALVPDFPFTGTVQAVYSKAIAVLNERGMLISLVGKSEHMEAFAVNLGSGFEEARMNLKEGQKITVCSGAGERWDPRPLLAGVRKELSCADESTLEYICDTIEHIMRSVWRGDSERAALSKEGIRGEGAFAERFSALEKSPDFPANVVGFGPGTTPAGDDFIAGFFCARTLLEKTESVKTQSIKKAVREKLNSTSLQGRTLLLGLVEGIPPFYLVNIALALASDSSGEEDEEDEEALIDAVLAALDHGASSGEDALWGFLSGFCAKDF